MTCSRLSARATGELANPGPKGRDDRTQSIPAMLVTLTFAGLRIGELCALRWRDVDLAAGWLHAEESKTDAGRRRVKLRGALRDELRAVRARHAEAPAEGFVFPTRTGGRQSPENLRSRVLKVAVERGNENLAERDLSPLPERITPPLAQADVRKRVVRAR